jgi:hypothetical protein
MGKIQLTENQYERLKKRLINEVGYYNNWIDVDFVNGTLTLNDYLDCERKGGGSELRMYKNTKFTKKPGSNELVANTTSSDLVGDLMGDVEEELGKATIRYSCNSKTLSIDGRNAKFWGEDWAPDVQKGFDDLCVQKLDGGISTAATKGAQKIDNNSFNSLLDKLTKIDPTFKMKASSMNDGNFMITNNDSKNKFYVFQAPITSKSGLGSYFINNYDPGATKPKKTYYIIDGVGPYKGQELDKYMVKTSNNDIVSLSTVFGSAKPTGGKSTSQKTYSKPKVTSKAADYLD